MKNFPCRFCATYDWGSHCGDGDPSLTQMFPHQTYFYIELILFSLPPSFKALSLSPIPAFQRISITRFPPQACDQEWSLLLFAFIFILGFILQVPISADTRRPWPLSHQLSKTKSDTPITPTSFNMSIVTSSSLRVMVGSIDGYALFPPNPELKRR